VVEEVVEELPGAVAAAKIEETDGLTAVWGDSSSARRLPMPGVELSVALFGIPNSVSTFSS
jgi:hypothetical protein